MRCQTAIIVAIFALECLASMASAQDFRITPPDEFLAGDEAGGEEEDEIETDRDSFTPATTVAGRRRIIFEAAHSFIDNRSVPETHSFPEMIVRVGLNERLEFRAGWNYEVGGAGNPISGNIPSDLNDENALERESRLLYGFKYLVSEQHGWRPGSAVILQGYTPTSGEADKTDMNATYVFGWILPNKWAWDSALRYGTSSLDDDNFNTWSPSTVLKIPVGEKWKVHVEYFGVFTAGRDDESVQHFFSPGAHYLVTPDLEIGARFGWGLNNEAPNFFSNAGLGYRY